MPESARTWPGRIAAAVLALAVGAVLTACSGVPTDAAAGQPTVAAAPHADAEVIDDDGKLPAWVAESFPIFPGSEVSLVSGSEHRSIVGLTANSSDGQQVIDWYTEQYSQNGWEIGDTQGDGSRFNAEHIDGYSAVVGVNITTHAIIVTLTAQDA